MRKITYALGVLAAVAICAPLVTAPARAQATVLQNLPIAGALPPNDCTGEPLLLAGTAQILLAPNGLQLKVADVTATGAVSGDEWTGVGVSTQTVTTTGGASGASTNTFTFQIRLTNGDDWFLSKGTSHVTVNADGTITSDFEFDNLRCR